MELSKPVPDVSDATGPAPHYAPSQQTGGPTRACLSACPPPHPFPEVSDDRQRGGEEGRSSTSFGNLEVIDGVKS